MSPRHAARQPPGYRTGVAEPGPMLPRTGLALAKPGTPRAFHGLEKARSQADEIEGHHDQVGSQRSFDLLRARSTLARRERPRTPSGPSVFSFALMSRPRGALRHSLVAASRCLETASTTDVSRHEHPRRNTTFGDCPPRAVGNPPALDLETATGTRRCRRSFGDGAGPPRGHPASNSPVLDGTAPASGRSAAHARAGARVGEKRRSLVG